MNAPAYETPGFDQTIDRMFRANLPGYGTNPVTTVLDWILRGCSQVVFQSNWLTGLIFYIGIGINSRVFLVAAILGTFVSTLTAWILGMDKGLISAGLLGFCGNLVGIAIPFYLGHQHSSVSGGNGGPLGDGTGYGGTWDEAAQAVVGYTAWGDWRLWLYIVLGAIMSTVFFAVLSSFLAPRMVPNFTAPFVFAGWFMLLAVKFFGAGFSTDCTLTMSAVDCGASPGPESLDWYQAVFNGMGEIWFQDNTTTGIFFLLGTLVNSRVSAAFMLIGSIIGAAGAALFGADLGHINGGLYSYSAILTAMALGGMFFVHDSAGILYTLFGTLMTVVAWGAVGTFMGPMGMPQFTFPFVLVSWLLVLAKPDFMNVTPIAPADSNYPEDNMRRHKAGLLAPGRP